MINPEIQNEGIKGCTSATTASSDRTDSVNTQTLPRLFRIQRTASKETPKVRVRLLLHPVDTFISMAVTSFYLRSSLETATQHCDSSVIYYNRLHWPREFGFGSPHSVPSNFLSAAVAASLAPTEITCLHVPIQSERAKESLFAPFQ
jgi:hypothetical protein